MVAFTGVLFSFEAQPGLSQDCLSLLGAEKTEMHRHMEGAKNGYS